MTNEHRPESTPSVNLVKMLIDHLPREYAQTKANILKLERALQDERATQQILVRHAAVAGIDLGAGEPADA